MPLLPLLLAVSLALPTAALAEISGPAYTIDGDTIEVGEYRIRLFGIDAPESRQTCNRTSDRPSLRKGDLSPNFHPAIGRARSGLCLAELSQKPQF
jgi:endonuclease YncB( thermonuclease family)